MVWFAVGCTRVLGSLLKLRLLTLQVMARRCKQAIRRQYQLVAALTLEGIAIAAKLPG
jgi:hypothetical protein